MAEMYLNGAGEPVGSSEMKEHALNVVAAKRSEEEQKALDEIWGD